MPEKDTNEKGWSALKGAMQAVKDAFPTSLVPLNKILIGVLSLIDHVETGCVERSEFFVLADKLKAAEYFLNQIDGTNKPTVILNESYLKNLESEVGELLKRKSVARVDVQDVIDLTGGLVTFLEDYFNFRTTLTPKGHVLFVSLSHDGTRIVSGSSDNTVQVWDATTGLEIIKPLRGHNDLVSCVAFSRDGTRIVSSSYDKTIQLWNAKTGADVMHFKGHTDWVTFVVFSPDGAHIVSGSYDKTIRMWDARTGQAKLTFNGHTGWVMSVGFSADATRIVSGSEDTTIQLWDAKTGLEVMTLAGHTDRVRSVSFSPDGTRIASGSDDKTIRIWDGTTGAALKKLLGHSDRVTSVLFSPDGARILSGSEDKTIRLWDARTGREEMKPWGGHKDWVRSVGFWQDGSRILSGSDDKTIRIWDARTGADILEAKRIEEQMKIEKRWKQKRLEEQGRRDEQVRRARELEEQRRQEEEMRKAKELRRREEELQRAKELEEQRRREEEVRKAKALEEERKRAEEPEAQRRQEEELRKAKELEAQRKQEKESRRAKELEEQRKREEEFRKAKELEERRRREEALRRAKELEAQRRREEEVRKAKELEEQRRREEELRKAKEREARRKQEELRRAKELEAQRKREEELQRAKELEEQSCGIIHNSKSEMSTVSPVVCQCPLSARLQSDHACSSYTMFTGGHIVINDGTFVQTNSVPQAEKRGFNLLTGAASPSAFHDGGHGHDSLPQLHHNTHAAVLDRIKGWISDTSAVPVMWLYGAAGAGKSSLAKSIAVWCERESRLLASFFFSRSDPSRDNIRRFIPTLAYTVIQVIPESQRIIEQAVESDPHIFSRSLDAQFSRLILRPLSALAPTLNGSQPSPHVIVIDELDGCHDEAAQKMILRLFTSTLSRFLGWKVLITSRPEKAIQISFDDEPLRYLCTRLALRHEENTPLRITKDIPLVQQDSPGIPPTEQFITPVPSSGPPCQTRIPIRLKNLGQTWITYSYRENGREYKGTLQDNVIREKSIEFYVNFPYLFTLWSGPDPKQVSRTFTMVDDWDLSQEFQKPSS